MSTKGQHIAVAFFVLLLSALSSRAAEPLELSKARWDFESGTLEGWTVVSGNLGKQPASNDNDRHGGSFNKHGKYFIGTYEDGAKPIGDQVIGELRSPVFVADAERLAMLIGGGNNIATTYVALCDANNDQELLKAAGQDAESMEDVVWDISRFRGRRLYLKVVDRPSPRWGHINLDNVRAVTKAEAARIQREQNPGPSLLDRILAYHAGYPRNGKALRVVYFSPRDRKPPKDFRRRLTRVMRDIQDFYHSEMIRNGFTKYNELPLEISHGLLTVYPVRGQDPEESYSGADGWRIYREVKRAVSGSFDADPSTMLIFNYLCQPQADGGFGLHTPFSGAPGKGWVLDCDWLDPAFLSDTKRRVSFYDLHSKDWRTTGAGLKKTEKSIGEFNGIFIGGAAHELGHALLLPHDGQTADEIDRLGLSLMGQGNWVYRRELWGRGAKGAFLSLADSLRLATHPLFTQSDRGRDLGGSIENLELNFTAAGKALKIEGRVAGVPEVLALLAYSSPKDSGGYDATTWVSEVKNGVFSDTVRQHKPGLDKLQLTFFFINGKVSTITLLYHVSAAGAPDADELNEQWRESQALGRVWDVTECCGWRGVWTRRGKSNIFDSVLEHSTHGRLTMVNVVTKNGDSITVDRNKSSDGILCTYTGTLDGATVSGTYCNGQRWQATIR
jgi:hypothetical protein